MNKKRVDTPPQIIAVSRILTDELKKAGFGQWILLSVKPNGQTADFWTDAHCSTEGYANMVAYAIITHLPQDQARRMMQMLATHPLLIQHLNLPQEPPPVSSTEEADIEEAQPKPKVWMN